MIKKKLGQNFLIDQNKIKQIIKNIPNLNKNGIFLEIGPGTGALTKDLINESKILIAVEIDKNLVELLEKKFQNKNFILINEDILNIDLEQILTNYDEVNFVSNLPYYIASKILFKVLDNKKISTISVMLQEEVADRILAQPKNKIYGRLTVGFNSFFSVQNIIKVKRTCFYPAPNVDSTFLVLERNKHNSIKDEEITEYLHFIKICFANKRKILLNSIKNNGPNYYKIVEKYLISNNYNLKTRSEELTINDYKKLWKYIKNN